MLNNSLKYYLKNDFDYFIFSNADVILSKKIVKILKSVKQDNYMGFIYPNVLIKNSKIESSFKPHYGIDFIAFKLSKDKAKQFLKYLNNYKQYNWGVIDNFYISIGHALKLKSENLFKKINLYKIENQFSDFKENRKWQIDSWKKNNYYFKKFLKKNNLPKLYATGSYYYLLFKVFKFKDMNLKLFLIYLRFYSFLPLNILKKIFKIFL